ncbi:MAG: DUF192 domain-containing protein [Bacteroidota bacterium]
MSHCVTVNNLSRPNPAPASVLLCDSFACRLRGLMFRRSLSPDEGLLLVQSRDSRLDSSIHMLFVPFDLAVFWIDSTLTVVDKVIARSWRPAYLPGSAARFVLEIHPQRWSEYEIGDRIEIRDA